MQMRVRHRLPARRAVGLQHSDPLGLEGRLHRAGDLPGRPHQGGGGVFVHVEQRLKGLLRGHDDMAVVDLAGVHERKDRSSS
jgi:hypothetical protein